MIGGAIHKLAESRHRALLDLLVDRVPNDHVLGVVGADPLEDFINAAEDRLAWIEQRAASSARFKETLAAVWIWHLPSDAFERVERAAGVPLVQSHGDANLDIVLGDLPGTIHITNDGITVSEIETEPDRVPYMIEFFKKHTRLGRTF